MGRFFRIKAQGLVKNLKKDTVPAYLKEKGLHGLIEINKKKPVLAWCSF